MNYTEHTIYTQPQTKDLQTLPADPNEAAKCIRGLTLHYVMSPNVPPQRESDRQSRWISKILHVLKNRSDQPLAQERSAETRFVGCCRDDALLLTAILREHGVPARIRIGFAPYLNPNFTHDHVITEWHNGQRWVRSDPEMLPEKFSFDTMDMPTEAFITAGNLWQKYRTGQLDDQEAERYGVAPDFFTGPPIMRDYVVRELLALTGHELLLWDNWGLLNTPFEETPKGQLYLIDQIAEALAIEQPNRWEELAKHPELRVPAQVKTFDFQGRYQVVELR